MQGTWNIKDAAEEQREYLGMVLSDEEMLTKQLVAEFSVFENPSDESRPAELYDRLERMSVETFDLKKMMVCQSRGKWRIKLSSRFYNSSAHISETPVLTIFPNSIVNCEARPVVATGLRGLRVDLMKCFGYEYISNGDSEVFTLPESAISRIYSIKDHALRYLTLVEDIRKFAMDVSWSYDLTLFKILAESWWGRTPSVWVSSGG